MAVINYLCDYLTKVGASKGSRDSLKANWNEGVKNRLAEHKDRRFIERRMVLPDTRIRLQWSDESRMIYNEGSAIWVASAVPSWRLGWSQHIKNEETRELITTYFHFLTQFWHRCNVTPVLVYIAHKYNESADWVGSSSIHSQGFSDERFESDRKGKNITSFLSQVNCHHPIVHNACYHFSGQLMC